MHSLIGYYHVTVFQLIAFQSTQFTVVYNVYFTTSPIFYALSCNIAHTPSAPHLARLEGCTAQ